MPTPLRILVLEDDPYDAELEIAILEEAGYSCRWERVEGRAEFRARLASPEPDYDLILADYNLPAFDGLTALKLVLKRAFDIPFILVSGTVGEETAIESLKAGATDYVLKDRISRLGPVVKRALLEQAERQGRRRAEKELRKLSRAVEQSPSLVVITDTEGNIEYVNPKFTQVTGYTPAEVSGQNPRILKSDQTPPAEYERLWQTITSGEEWRGEFYNKKKNGEFYWTSTSISPIRGSMGNVTHFLAVQEDITERKRAEEALRESEEKYRTLFEHLPIPVFTKNRQGEYTSCNAENRKYWAVSPIGRTDAELLDPEPAAALREVDLRVMETGDTLTVEEHLVNTLLGERQVLSRKMPLRDGSGNIVGILGAGLDITGRKQLEEQLRLAQKMEAVGQLTAGIAHDFNNLLTAINGFAELIRRKLSPNDPLGEMVGKISESGQRAANLIRQLMVFSRKQIAEPKVLDLNEVVYQIEKMLRRIIGEHIDLKTTLAPELWPVKVDPAQFEQVIVNLAVNARDAMPNGGELIIETTNTMPDEDYEADHFQADSGEYALLVVSDTGVGMSKEVQARVFEPFFTTKEMGQGTGLGLATVYGIVKQNGGDIRVYSEEGQGSTFKIYLPRAEEAPPPRTRLESLAEIPVGSETILLVEDAEGVRELASDVLQMQGYTVLEARNGQESLQLAAHYSGPIHLLLTDVVMPGMSGKALAERLRQIKPKLKVLFMSGYTENAIAHHGVLDPGVAFLQKPFNPMALAHKVRQVLDAPSKGQP